MTTQTPHLEPVRQPQDYLRRVLLCVTGESPQIVSETLYAIYQENAAAIPTEIHLVTTTTGRDIAIHELLDQGRIRALLDSYAPQAEIKFDPSTIHVVKNSEGEPLADIRSITDNSSVADTILSVVNTITLDPDSCLHASIAGGRKSMSFYMGYCLSLLGRPQDRLSHVLVNPPAFESREFYYPPRPPQVLETVNGPMSTDQADIELAYIPFVRMGSNLKSGLENFLKQDEPFNKLVNLLQLGLEYPHVEINKNDKNHISIGRTHPFSIKLAPKETVLYTWLAQRCQSATDEPWINRQPPPTLEELEVLKGILVDFGVDKDNDIASKLMDELSSGRASYQMTWEKHIETGSSNINKALLSQVGPVATNIFGIHKDKSTGYKISSAPNIQIEIIEPKF